MKIHILLIYRIIFQYYIYCLLLILQIFFCNLPSIEVEATDNEAIAKTLRAKLVQSLREINNAYDKLSSLGTRLL